MTMRSWQKFIISRKSKVVPLHAMIAGVRRGGVTPLILHLGQYMSTNAQIRV
jgi:hypothetical protein